MKFLVALCYLFCQLESAGQVNHVPNGSFETLISCPGDVSDFTGFCQYWFAYTAGSPDLMNTCTTDPSIGVPVNSFGYQMPVDGNGYAGIYGYEPDYREYMATGITPLQHGARYEVSMSISLNDYSYYGTNGLGVYFFDKGQSTQPVTTPLSSITPQVSYDFWGIDTNKAGWTRMVSTFVADSAYDTLVIGNFHSDQAVSFMVAARQDASPWYMSYYLVDSVVVKLKTNIQFAYTDTSLCPGDTVTVNYTVTGLSSFQAGNTFTLELSDANGSFGMPITLASVTATFSGQIKGVIPSSILSGNKYRIRIKATSPVEASMDNGVNIRITRPPVVVASSNSPVCENEILSLLSSSAPGASYKWSGPKAYSASTQNATISFAKPAQSGTYSVTAALNGCVSAPQSINVIVNPIPFIGGYASPGDTICQGADATFLCFPQNPGTVPVYQWYKNFVAVPGADKLLYKAGILADGDRIYCGMTVTGVCNASMYLTTDTFEMVVLPIVTEPEVSISAVPGLAISPLDIATFTANVTNGGTAPKYQWYKNGLMMPGAEYATLTTTGLNFGDQIRVDIVGEDPCSVVKTASDTVFIGHPLAVITSAEGKVSLFPNPNIGQFSIAGLPPGNAKIEIMNMAGQVLYHRAMLVGDSSLFIETKLQSGNYLIRIMSSKYTYWSKLTIATQ